MAVAMRRRRIGPTAGPAAGRRYNGTMKQQLSLAPGIEVQEQPLNSAEAGFLTGMFEAWANRTMTEADFRNALEAVMSKENRLDG